MAHSDQSNLDAKVKSAQEQVLVGATYVHYKTKGKYKVLHIGLQESTEEPCVIYQNELGMVWVRDVSVWLEHVRNDDGKLVERFSLVK